MDWPKNDSDGDGQANIKELSCAEGDPLDAAKRCQWLSETPEGLAFASSDFVYIPGGFDVDGDGVEEKGFWTSSYQARARKIEISEFSIINIVGNYRAFIQNNFTLLNSSETIKYYQTDELTESLKGQHLTFSEVASTPRESALAPYLALASLKQFEIRDASNNVVAQDFKFLSLKQYMQITKLLEADLKSGGDGKTIRNNLLGIDVNIPLGSHGTKVYEFAAGKKEYLSELLWLVDENSVVKFFLDDIDSWWGVDMDHVAYHHETQYGANATIDVGMGVGIFKDNYAVMVRGGNVLDLYQGTTGVDSDIDNQDNGIGFRAATAYLP
ncbi:MAG TPA: hypothetical protein ENK94_03050 [Campylobacterales bacterium]|nr:hypothetical protein [Campylobacterales bacterium]